MTDSEPRLAASIIDAHLALPAARVPGRRGHRATAAWDEDALTLAATAGLRILAANPGIRPEALITASVSPPLEEMGVAPTLVEVLGLQAADGTDGLHVQQHGGTVAAGAGAVTAALALVAAGIEPILIVAADTRRDAGGRAYGDGAVAVLLGSSGDGGRLRHLAASACQFVDRWRMSGETQVRTGDRSLDSSTPGGAFARRFADEGFDAPPIATGVEGPALDRAGFLGCASTLAAVITADLDPGSRVAITASAGGISHALEFESGPAAGAIAERARAVLAGGEERKPPPAPALDEFDPYVSQPAAHRELGQNLRLEARRDPDTGEVLYPPPPEAAGADLERITLARTGELLTFTRDHVFPLGGPLYMGVVELDGGGRFYGQMTDADEVEIGMRVTLVLRRLHTGGGIPHYFWKIAPERESS